MTRFCLPSIMAGLAVGVGELSGAGYIRFSNFVDSELNAPILGADDDASLPDPVPIEGDLYKVELLVGETTDSLGTVAETDFSTGSAPGFVDGGIVDVGMYVGAPVFVRVRVWNTGCGVSFFDATMDGDDPPFECAIPGYPDNIPGNLEGLPIGRFGNSQVFPVVLGSASSPAILEGLTGFNLETGLSSSRPGFAVNRGIPTVESVGKAVPQGGGPAPSCNDLFGDGIAITLNFDEAGLALVSTSETSFDVVLAIIDLSFNLDNPIACTENGAGGLSFEITEPNSFIALAEYDQTTPGDRAVSFKFLLNTGPTITEIDDQTIVENGSTGALPFTVGDDFLDPDDLILSGTSSNTDLIPNGNIDFGGSGENRTVNVTPNSDVFGGPATIEVSVSDGFESVMESFAVTIQENTPPTISEITDQSVVENNTLGPIDFTVGDGETAAGSLAVSGTSSDTTIIPQANIVFGGSDANRTVTLAPADDQNGGPVTITVEVSDGSLSASETFEVTVDAVNDLLLFENSVALGDDWNFTEWFGIFNDRFFRWVFHLEHGWMYVFEGSDDTSIFLFDLSSESWYWTSSTTYPSLYSFGRASWVFYFVGTSNPRDLVDLITEEFFQLP